jgi:hypothetical protein
MIDDLTTEGISSAKARAYEISKNGYSQYQEILEPTAEIGFRDDTGLVLIPWSLYWTSELQTLFQRPVFLLWMHFLCGKFSKHDFVGYS